MKTLIKIMLIAVVTWSNKPVKGEKPDSPAYLIVYYKMEWHSTFDDSDIKYLFISKYLIKCPDYYEKYGLPQLSNFSSKVWRQFREDIVFKINIDEHHNKVISYIDDVPEEIQEISDWSVSGGYNGNFIFYDDVLRNDTPEQAAIKVRNTIIREAKAEGYKIRQVNFIPRSGDSNGSEYDFSFYDADRNEHLYCQISTTNPLSIYDVEPYSKGEVKIDIDAQFAKTTSSNSNSSSSSSSKSNKKEEVDYSVKQGIAQLYEREGDELMKKGYLYYGQALEKYKQAQLNFYTLRVQEKIDNINALSEVSKLADKGFEKLDDVSYSFQSDLDAIGIPSSRAFSISFSGLDTYFKDKKSGIYSKGYTGSVHYSNYRLLAIDIGLSLLQSPVYDLKVKNSGNNEKIVQVSELSLGPSLHAGLAIPLKYVMFFGLFGFDLSAVNLGTQVVTENYLLTTSPPIPLYYLKKNIRSGLLFKIPRTPIAIGIHYTYNWYGLPENETSGTFIDEKKTEWEIIKSSRDTYSAHQIGVMLRISKKKDDYHW